MAHLKLLVLGQPRLEREGGPVELNLRKALALLVYLAVSGQPQSRDGLATLLWPESDQREGRARLRRILHRLNEALGDDVLEAGPDTIRSLPQADLWLDSVAFRQHVAAGLPAAPGEALAPERITHLTAAIELYSDDFLAGFTLPDSPAFDEWQFFQRESLRQLYGQVLEQLVQAHRAQQAWEPAIDYARRWVALDGLHEPAHRMLMRLYAWAGKQAAALRQYQECVRMLEAELGVVPEAETIALYEAIRSRQFGPSAAKSSPAPPSPTDEVATPPRTGAGPITLSAPARPAAFLDNALPVDTEDPVFVAREQELGRLDALLAAALKGQHRSSRSSCCAICRSAASWRPMRRDAGSLRRAWIGPTCPPGWRVRRNTLQPRLTESNAQYKSLAVFEQE